MAKKTNRKNRRKKSRESLEEGRPAYNQPGQESSLPSPRTRFSLFVSTLPEFLKRSWKAMATVGVLLGLLTGGEYFMPQLSATTSTTLIETNPLSTCFIIANEGHLELNEVAFACRVNYATDGKGHHYAKVEDNFQDVFRAYFPAKDKIGMPCLTFLKLPQLAKGDISILVEYRPSFWPLRRRWEARFVTQVV